MFFSHLEAHKAPLCCHIHALTAAHGKVLVQKSPQQEGASSLLTERLQVIKDEALLGSFIAVYEQQLPSLVETLVEAFPLSGP